MRFLRFMAPSLFLLVLFNSLSAQQVKSNYESKTPQAFVQEFYDWYTPIALNENTRPAWVLALRDKSHIFNSNLFKLLSDDYAAQTKAIGEIVGIDFDPFLNSQDPDEHYETGQTTQKDGHYFVNVYGAHPGKKDKSPNVVAELAKEGNHWSFVNFHYRNKDLLTILKLLKDSRQKDLSR